MKIQVKTEVDVSMTDLANLLCNAFEGGIGHWAVITGYTKPEKVWTGKDWESGTPRYIHYPLSEGGAVRLRDAEDEETEWTLDLPAIKRGLAIMAEKYPRHWKNFAEDYADAETGDVLVQCALMGELVYG